MALAVYVMKDMWTNVQVQHVIDYDDPIYRRKVRFPRASQMCTREKGQRRRRAMRTDACLTSHLCRITF